MEARAPARGLKAAAKVGDDRYEVAPWASAHQGDHLLGIAGAEVREPTWFGSLPCLTILIASSLLSVMGEFALEVFAGSAVLTLGMMLSNAPVLSVKSVALLFIFSFV